MDKKDVDVCNEIEDLKDLKPVDPEALEDFKRMMVDEVIPEIIRVVEERHMLVAASRERYLKC